MSSVPHVTNAIQDWIERVARIPVDESGAEPEVCIIELGRYLLSFVLESLRLLTMPKGGTVGDIESAPFIHAISQLQTRAGRGNFVHIHVSYVPVLP